MSAYLAAASADELARFCERWNIRELALFGSALRDDFGPESDVDILVTPSADANWGLLDHIQMQQELQTLWGRKVDLITRRALQLSRNWLLRDEIQSSAQIMFPRGRTKHATG